MQQIVVMSLKSEFSCIVMVLLSVGLGLFSSDKGCWINLVGLEKSVGLSLLKSEKV